MSPHSENNEKFQDSLQNSKVFKPAAPLPLTQLTLPAEPFPLQALGSLLSQAAEGICDIIQAPLEICGQSVLAAATLAVQAHGDVWLPIGQKKPISGYFVSVAATGERKSSCDGEALAPAKTYEESLSTEYKQEYEAWSKKHAAWTAQKQQILKDKKGCPDFASKESALKGLGSEPVPPMNPMVTCTEPTFEGLCRYFIQGRPTIGLFSDEGGQFVGGHGMNQDEKLKTSAALSDLWDGNPIKRIRAGDGTIILRGRRLSMHLMLQPDIARLLLSDSTLKSQGFLSRMLVAAPCSKIGTRFYRQPLEKSRVHIEDYKNHLVSLFQMPLPLVDETSNELIVPDLTLSPKARQAWIGFSDHLEKHMASGQVFELVRAMVNKSAQHAARLAAVLTLIKNISTREIAIEEMEAGIELAQFYNSEALRLFTLGKRDKNIVLAEKLLAWLHFTWGKDYVALPDIYQRGINAISTKDEALRLVSILEEHGWLVRVEEGMKFGDVFRQDVWKIIKDGESQ